MDLKKTQLPKLFILKKAKILQYEKICPFVFTPTSRTIVFKNQHFSKNFPEEILRNNIFWNEIFINILILTESVILQRWQGPIHNGTLKSLSDQVCIGYRCLWFSKLIIFNWSFSLKVTCVKLTEEKRTGLISLKPLST